MASFLVNAFSIEPPAIIDNEHIDRIFHQINFTSLLPDLLRYLVEAMYDALTVRTTAFIKFFAAVINDVALSS